MIDLSQYDALIFDMDGTLIDSMPSHLDASEVTCKYYGYAVDRDFIHALGGVPSLTTASMLNEKFGLAHDPHEVAQHKIATWEALGSLPELIDLTTAIVRQYAGLKPMAIGTGSRRDHALQMLRHVDILDKFDALVCSTDVQQGKPHPETFLTAASHLGVEPHKCVVFEDTQIGLQAAHAAGMDCILIEGDRLALYPR